MEQSTIPDLIGDVKDPSKTLVESRNRDTGPDNNENCCGSLGGSTRFRGLCGYVGRYRILKQMKQRFEIASDRDDHILSSCVVRIRACLAEIVSSAR
jgi:hypothetical protein